MEGKIVSSLHYPLEQLIRRTHVFIFVSTVVDFNEHICCQCFKNVLALHIFRIVFFGEIRSRVGDVFSECFNMNGIIIVREGLLSYFRLFTSNTLEIEGVKSTTERDSENQC